jgi:hypothetical protein
MAYRITPCNQLSTGAPVCERRRTQKPPLCISSRCGRIVPSSPSSSAGDCSLAVPRSTGLLRDVLALSGLRRIPESKAAMHTVEGVFKIDTFRVLDRLGVYHTMDGHHGKLKHSIAEFFWWTGFVDIHPSAKNRGSVAFCSSLVHILK